jgi:small subunit ribosomal protein S17
MTATQAQQRGNRQRLRGVVVRDKASRTITVEVMRRFQHPRYGKMVRRHTRLAAHDPADEAKIGDTVEIVSCRPLSKTKRYRLVRIVERGPGEALVGQPPARPEAEKPEPAEPAPAETATETAAETEADQPPAAGEAADTESAETPADTEAVEGPADEDTSGDEALPAT